MALGLFSSLIVGLILDQIGSKLGISILVDLGRVAKFLMGPAIGIAVAYGRKAPALAVFSSAVTGALGAGTVFLNAANQYGIRVGEPMGAFIAALVGVEVGKLISGKTKVDIVLVPSSVRYCRQIYIACRIGYNDCSGQHNKYSHCNESHTHGHIGFCYHGRCIDASHKQCGISHSSRA